MQLAKMVRIIGFHYSKISCLHFSSFFLQLSTVSAIRVSFLVNILSDPLLVKSQSEASKFRPSTIYYTLVTLYRRIQINISIRKYTEAGIFARNLTDFARTAGPLLNLAPAKDAKPTKFLVPKDFFPGSDAKRQELSDIFVSAVEKATGLKAEHISLADTWAKLAPAHAKGLSLNDFIGDVSITRLIYIFVC